MSKKHKAAAKAANVAEEIVLADGAEITVSDADINDAELGAAIADIEIGEAKAAAYAEQPAEVAGESVAIAATDDTPTEVGKSKAVRTPRMSLVSSKASAIIAHHSAALGGLVLTTDGDKMEGDSLDAVDKLDKKTREKAVNLVYAVANNKRPSVYTVQALKALRANDGTISLKGLTDYFLTTCGYKAGTARRQASEMFALLPAFRIASKADGKGTPLVLNSDSTLLAAIETLASAPVAAPAAE